MFFVTLIFQLFAQPIVHFINPDPAVEAFAEQALRIISIGYIFYGIGMVVTNAFNGAGDTKTPTIINIFVYWLMQVPLAYWLAISLKMGPKGVFLTVLFAETASTIIGIIIFRQGKWKKVRV
jgi:Na+-driven multidrug efflux pump